MESLSDYLQSLIGRPAHQPVVARDVVSSSSVRAWCDAMGELGTRYRNAEPAPGRTQLAPPATLQMWTMPGLEPGRPLTSGPARPGDLDGEVRARLNEAGYTGFLATNTEQEFVEPIAVGDLILAEDVYVSVTEEKQTALGAGFFVTTRTTYRRRRAGAPDAVVGYLTLTCINFRPADTGSVADVRPAIEASPAEHGVPAADLTPSTTLEPVVVPVTPTLIVTGALATFDFYPVHHDRDFARAHGNTDILPNIQTTTGLLARIAEEWCGGATLRRLETRLRAPAYPYDRLTVTGEVLAASGREVRIGLRAELLDGVHAEAIATFELDGSCC
jgi:acyl dehydratase